MPLTGLAPSVAFVENAAAPQLLDADVVFTSDTPLADGRLVVRGLRPEDRISVLHQGDGAGQISVVGSTVSFDGVVIGTASGGQGGDFTVTFNANVTDAGVEALVERLAYTNPSDAPTATRNLTIDVVGADGTIGGIGPLTALTGSANPFASVHAGAITSPAFLDLDGDGDLDLISGLRSGYGISVARNTGSASAPVFTPLTGSDNPLAGLSPNLAMPAFVDLDGDGDLDLVAGTFFDGLFVAENVGTGAASAFTAGLGGPDPLDTVWFAYRDAPAFADLDGDGDLDVVLGWQFGTFATWLNTGTGAAPVFTRLNGTANPLAGFDVGIRSTPAFVDFDGDGDLDLVSGRGDGTFTAFRNTGTATSPAFSELTGADNPFAGFNAGSQSAPAFVDLDADGDLDLVSGASSGPVRA